MALSFQQLLQSCFEVSPTRRNYAASKMQRLVNIVPYSVQKSALFQFEHHGLTTIAQYQANLFWSGISILETEQSTNTHMKATYKGKIIWITKPSLNNSPLVVRCTCPDFYFTFAWWNMESRALFGPRPRPYVRKDPTRASRNPGHHPGICKHLCNSVRAMASQKLVVP